MFSALAMNKMSILRILHRGIENTEKFNCAYEYEYTCKYKHTLKIILFFQICNKFQQM